MSGRGAQGVFKGYQKVWSHVVVGELEGDRGEPKRDNNRDEIWKPSYHNKDTSQISPQKCIGIC